jgi:hypothetical protein
MQWSEVMEWRAGKCTGRLHDRLGAGYSLSSEQLHPEKSKDEDEQE